MDWARLPFFLAVARAGSLRAGADAMDATHAKLDRNLRALVDDYGARLFDRTRRRLEITPTGEALVPLPDWVKTSPFPKARLRYLLRSPNLIAQMVGAGMGMSFLPFFYRRWVDGLVQVPGTEAYLDRSIWLPLRSDLRRTTRVRVLLGHLAREIKVLRPIFLAPLAAS